MFEQKTIKYILERVNIDYFLPAIQRDYVWEETQIINLFDSILKGFPIGTFLFWKVTSDNIAKYDYYGFIKDYDVNKKYNDQKFLLDSRDSIVSILDGQQRITSLLIGLQGSYTKNKQRSLYINLSKMNETEDIDDIETKYEFRFMSADELQQKKHESKWFKVSEILNMQSGDVTIYSIENKLEKLGIEIISELYNVIHNQERINYYLIEEDNLDKVLSIFVRINKGGTHLSYSDLLLSIATANWSEMSARDEINNLINEVGYIEGDFAISKDFVLKTALLLIDETTKFTSTSLKKDNMLLMEKNWYSIKEAIIKAFVFMNENNFDNKSLPSVNAVALVAYFYYLYGDFRSENEKKQMFLFIIKSLLKNLYSSSLDTVLEVGRRYIRNLKKEDVEFSCQEMINPSRFKNMEFTQLQIDALLTTRITQKSFMLILHLLYNTKNAHGLMEIISREKAKDYNGKYKDYLNTICNYQLRNVHDIYLSAINQSIGIDNLSDSNIDNMLNTRYDNMRAQLVEILNPI